MNEADARAKWCPWGRTENPPIGADTSGATAPMLCCASDCMQWRWYRPDADQGGGYCGLAGIEGSTTQGPAAQNFADPLRPNAGVRPTTP